MNGCFDSSKPQTPVRRRHTTHMAHGDRKIIAGEYHSADFEWEELHEEVGERVDAVPITPQTDGEAGAASQEGAWEGFYGTHAGRWD
jgi:hypothetical protein